jgi:DNA ligase (NAD+)
LDIEGLGSETAALLVERGLVRELADLFELTSDQLQALPGFGRKSAENLVQAIRDRQSTEFRRFLFGLGIPEVGVSVASDLAVYFREFEALREADVDVLQEVRGVGPKMAEQIQSFLHDPRIYDAVQSVFEKMELLKAPDVTTGSGLLEGMRFVFTGTLESMTRAEAKQLVEMAGAKTTSGVSKETDFLVRGQGGGSKVARAREFDVRILNEQAFLERLGDLGFEV